jgi:GntR family transcriptional regulator
MILENEGLISREQGRGTFVTGGKGTNISFDLYGYVDDLLFPRDKNRLQLNSKKLIKAGLQTAQEMGVEEGDEIYSFEGLRHLGKHVAFFQAYLPKEIGEKIFLGELDNPFLLLAVERESREMAKRADQTISAAVATKRLASIMKIRVGHPLLVIKRIYFSKNGRVLEMAITHFRGDSFQSFAKLGRIIS